MNILRIFIFIERYALMQRRHTFKDITHKTNFLEMIIKVFIPDGKLTNPLIQFEQKRKSPPRFAD